MFQRVQKDILWDSDDNDNLIVGNIQIYGKNFIMYLDHNTEYKCYSWHYLFLPDSLEPNKEIKQVNIRPTDYVGNDDW